MSGSSEAFYFFKGRVALYALLKAMGIGPEDEVLVPGFTCVVVPNAVLYLGAKPVFVDIEASTYNMDTGKLDELITGKTRAIIAQHTFGIPADMDSIVGKAKARGLYVIEDSCHAIGSKYKGGETGSFGDAAFFSSQWSKPVTTGLGGWAVVRDEALRKNMRKVYDGFKEPSPGEIAIIRLQYLVFSRLVRPSLFWFAQGAYRRLSGLGLAIGSSEKKELESEMPAGYEKKMSGWQRKLLKKKLSEIHRSITHRKTVVSLYEGFLKEAGVGTVFVPVGAEPVFLRYPVMVKDKMKALGEARKRRIEIGDWFLSPVHPCLGGWKRAGYEEGMCPVSEEVSRHVVNLPTHLRIGEREIEKIVDFIVEQNG